MINYNKYEFSKNEYIKYLSVGVILAMGISYLFYRNIILSIILSPLSLVYIKNKKNKRMEERKWNLNLEFRDGILSILTALSAGYSIENSFNQAVKDLSLMYSPENDIIKEFSHIIRLLKVNVTAEEAIRDFAVRSDLEDINNFSEVFTTAKRTGGDINKIIRMTGNNISDKIEIKREIRTLITAKRFEVKIMNIIPFGIILYLQIVSPEFIGILYHNIMGITIMTMLLLVYYFSFRLSEKIIDIEI